ncbi:hypothetical protein PCASD_09414 [Puccinia coronata f. sp. avenae]|uniref:Uncharacterized protein n=1 Tax=Puccinia coronata f. sp. avenae TaxID=200324 RepID=A0A2N5UHP9_9BASI|nr:hypothetical protein PCASD_09414 [Puccinia coronata f. sp. avenae]
MVSTNLSSDRYLLHFSPADSSLRRKQHVSCLGAKYGSMPPGVWVPPAPGVVDYVTLGFVIPYGPLNPSVDRTSLHVSRESTGCTGGLNGRPAAVGTRGALRT